MLPRRAARHAAGLVDVELTLHATLLLLGLANEDLDPILVCPTTLGHTSYLLATANEGSFAGGWPAEVPLLHMPAASVHLVATPTFGLFRLAVAAGFEPAEGCPSRAFEFCGWWFRPVRLGLVAPEPRLDSPLRTP
jgi:hypothetical protein